MSGEGKLNKTAEQSEEGGAKRGELGWGRGGGGWGGGQRGRKQFVTNEGMNTGRKREERD